MIVPTTMHSDTKTRLTRSPRRIVTDFAVAFFVFNIIACAFMPKQMDARAHSGADNDYASAQAARSDVKPGAVHGLVNTAATPDVGHFTQLFSMRSDQNGKSQPAPTGLLFLAFVFAALTALNLQLVRHLREAYAVPARGNRTAQAPKNGRG
jgi:hypothetical protein